MHPANQAAPHKEHREEGALRLRFSKILARCRHFLLFGRSLHFAVHFKTAGAIGFVQDETAKGLAMYKLLLCIRYVRSRYIALASIISVTLGVATMIVVNSVMAGFQDEMYKRLHGILSDVIVEAHSTDGMDDSDVVENEIRNILRDDVKGMTATVHIPAMLAMRIRGDWITKQVTLIGIDEATYADVGDFSRYLLHPENRRQLRFELRDDGYDPRLGDAGWSYRRHRVAVERLHQEQQEEMRLAREQIQQSPENLSGAGDDSLPGSSDSDGSNGSASGQTSAEAFSHRDPRDNPFASLEAEDPQPVFDAANEQWTGIVLGIAVSNIRHRRPDGQVADFFMCKPGDDIIVTFATAGPKPQGLQVNCTVVDFYESKMSEYDSSFAFMPLRKLQELRGMIDPMSKKAAVSSIQIKLREGADLEAARDKLQARFPAELFPYRIQTWKELQGPLLSAVQMETTILNILLFLIIAVAGFGILATFFMIVVEKTRDIGILKSLGASRRGVMSIFVSYGLSLGCVGAGVGSLLGLLFVININRIAAWLERVTGREVFDPTVYYFQEIPAVIDPRTIAWIAAGAMLIAVLASVLPAARAARMHPVEALRYE
jgi:lipoprotein-releasing system permease protein